MSEQLPDDSAQLQQPQESQQPSDDTRYFPDLKAGDAWGESITMERVAELEAILQAWDAESGNGAKRKGPFHHFPLTGADVFWLTARATAESNRKQAILAQAEHIRDHHEGVTISSLPELRLENTFLLGADLKNAFLGEAHLERAQLKEAYLEGANLMDAHMEGASLSRAHLEGANLNRAHLERTDLGLAILKGANLVGVHLEGASLRNAHVEGANLELAFLDSATALNDVVLSDEKYGYVSIADVRWAMLTSPS